MELRVLRYLLETAREGNMSRAAQKLHITQPTMSKQLRDLEQELNAKLYSRTNYRIELTDAGRLLQKRAEDILDLVDKTLEEFQDFAALTKGTIYIGSAESESFSLIAQTIKDIQQSNPHIQLHLFSGNIQDVLEKLNKGLIDFAFIMDYIESTKYESLKMPKPDHWGLIVPKTSDLTKHKSLRLDDLFYLPLICSRQNMMIDFPRWFGPDTNKLNVVATFNLLYNASIMVREGVGYALAYDKLANTALAGDLRFIPLENISESTMFCLWRKNQILSPLAQLFLKELRKRL